MPLIRNKVTGDLIKCSDFEVEILTCPQRFRDFMNTQLASGRHSAVIDSFEMAQGVMELTMRLEHDSVPIVVKDVLNGNYQEVPDTETTRILYGKK